MTARDRERHEQNRKRQSPVLPSEDRAEAHSGHTNTWLIRDVPSQQVDVVWLKRRMPADQWPPDPKLPRDNTFGWWVRSNCGHEGGAKQWAFYREADANTYEQIFRANPCHYTRCPHSMIENDRRMRR